MPEADNKVRKNAYIAQQLRVDEANQQIDPIQGQVILVGHDRSHTMNTAQFANQNEW